MKKFGVFLISTVLLFIGVIVLSFFITKKLNDYKERQIYISEQLNFEERMLNAWEWIPMTNVGDGKVKTWQEEEQIAQRDYKGALFFGLILITFVVVYVFANALVYRNTEQNYRVYGLISVCAALSFLYLGLTAPLIEIMAYSLDLNIQLPISQFTGESFFGTDWFDATALDIDRTLDGRTYYFYQNKSIMQLIYILYTGGNFLVALLLLGFSVIFPVFKLIVSVVVLISPEKKRSIKLYKIIKNLGKWSMADVFVCTVFLAIFSFSNMEVGIDTGASTLAGTYFFLIFVVISISSGRFLKLAMKKAQEVPNGLLEFGFPVAEEE